MRGSKSKDTKPELAVRRALREMRIGYRLHHKDLPGRPDIAMLGRKKAIFVHGCFWHQHLDPNCPISRRPESNTRFWNEKFARNRERDALSHRQLAEGGFEVLTIWECYVQDGSYIDRLAAFLS